MPAALFTFEIGPDRRRDPGVTQLAESRGRRGADPVIGVRQSGDKRLDGAAGIVYGLAYRTGVRMTEVLRLRVSDIDLEDMTGRELAKKRPAPKPKMRRR